MKNLFKRFIVPVAIVCSVMCLSSCTDDEEDAEDAAVFMCSCIKTQSLDDCFEEMKKKWTNYSNTIFYEHFNEVNTCNLEIRRE